MKQRAITALFFVATIIIGVYCGRECFLILFTLVTAGSLWELTGLLLDQEETHYKARRALGLMVGIAPVIWWGATMLYDNSCQPDTEAEPIEFLLHTQSGRLFIGMAMLILLISLLFLFELYAAAKQPFANIGVSLLGFFYISVPVMALFALSTPECQYQPNRVFGLLWLVWTNDTLAYLIGSQIGRTKLFERISPKKTWEGTIGGVIGTILMAWALAHWVPVFTTAQWLALGAVISVFGTLGDLVESMLKRSVGIKDSGSLFPGHGGFLDRFDAFLFMLPLAWLAVKILGG